MEGYNLYNLLDHYDDYEYVFLVTGCEDFPDEPQWFVGAFGCGLQRIRGVTTL